jgi:hypothetical protein
MVSIAAELLAGSSLCPHVRPKHGCCWEILKRASAEYRRVVVGLASRWAFPAMISGSEHN